MNERNEIVLLSRSEKNQDTGYRTQGLVIPVIWPRPVRT